ncbi:MAG: glutathione peroxidase [Acidobacteria bacterium]|nr:glutathione peroxidase [Acidobacteriota bacterium]
MAFRVSLKRLLLTVALSGGLLVAAASLAVRQMSATARVDSAGVDGSAYEFSVAALDGNPTPLATYQGTVSLIVNVASECGLAGQYQDIDALHRRFASRGFTVLAFPSNDFLQEVLDETGIARMCQARGYAYPMFARTHVRGDEQHPLYRFLARATGETPPWNFGKYLVDRHGRPLAYFGPLVQPDDPALLRAIEEALTP